MSGEDLLSLKKKSGRLIAFEGIDGAGKSTQVRLFEEYLNNRGIKSLFLREPTNGRWGKKIRSLLEEKDGEISPEDAFHLFTMDRRENVKKNILPALGSGRTVILDRYYFSSIAYQGALGIDTELIRSSNESFAPKPDLVFLLEITPQKGLRRIEKGRGNRTTLYEKSGYLAKVKKIFRSMKDPCIRRINASRTVDEVREKIIAEFEKIS